MVQPYSVEIHPPGEVNLEKDNFDIDELGESIPNWLHSQENWWYHESSWIWFTHKHPISQQLWLEPLETSPKIDLEDTQLRMIWYLWRISDIKHATSAKLGNKKKDSLPQKVGIFQNTVVLAVKIYEMFFLKENGKLAQISPLHISEGPQFVHWKVKGMNLWCFFLQKPQGGGNFTFLVKLREKWYVFSWWNFNPPLKRRVFFRWWRMIFQCKHCVTPNWFRISTDGHETNTAGGKSKVLFVLSLYKLKIP